uniref:3-hydroxyacyl-CoA dehydrogenase NAD binding domain-containing protein n=1 Tax=Populus trichocarpa TaxID=3694 RepID=A0A2K2BLU3_POPTR
MNTKVVVGGGGLMGFGIATTLIISKYLVTLKEVNKKFLTAGIERTKANFQSRVKKGNKTLKESLRIVQQSPYG